MKLSAILQNDVEELKQDFQVFIAGTARNKWLEGQDTVRVYVRRGHHLINGDVVKTLDIASIEVHPDLQGMGIGMHVINWMHENNPYGVTFIESILNDKLYATLKREGWIDVPETTPPSVYKQK